MTVKRVKLADLTPDARNANKGTPRGSKALEDSLRKFGAGRSILVDKHGRIIAGNKTAEEAGQIGLEDVIVIETDGKQLVAVKRTDIDLDSPQGRGLAVADNRAGELNLAWDAETLIALQGEGVNLDGLFTGDELAGLLQDQPPEPPPDFGSYDEGIDTEYCCPKCGYKWSGKPNADA